MPGPGAVLAGRYRIIAPLGAGGMATVHRARDERLERDVAVKILLPNHAGDPVLAARFEREARSLAAAAHPGVVAVFDVDPGDPTAGVEPFFVMELCSGGSLADRLKGGQRLSPGELIPIIISIADGLAGLHAAGIVHRDVKPSNILLAPARAKLADFGLARSDDPAASSDLTAPGTAVGTMGYLAPDVLAGATAGPPGDVYALGVAAFNGLTGSMPRSAGSVTELIAAGEQLPPIASSVAPELGTAFDAPLAAALDPDPARRPDALSFASSLTTALGKWSRSRSSPPSGGVRPGTDLYATTAVVPVSAPASWEHPLSDRERLPRRPRGSSANLITAVLIGALIVVGIALASGRFDGPGLGSSAAASPTPSSSPSVRSSGTTVAPTSAPTTSVAAQALAALDEVDAAIAAAGMKDKDAKDLQKRAESVGTAIDRGDHDAAAKAADELTTVVGKGERKIGEDQARRLSDAVNKLAAILHT